MNMKGWDNFLYNFLIFYKVLSQIKNGPPNTCPDVELLQDEMLLAPLFQFQSHPLL